MTEFSSSQVKTLEKAWDARNISGCIHLDKTFMGTQLSIFGLLVHPYKRAVRAIQRNKQSSEQIHPVVLEIFFFFFFKLF